MERSGFGLMGEEEGQLWNWAVCGTEGDGVCGHRWRWQSAGRGRPQSRDERRETKNTFPAQAGPGNKSHGLGWDPCSPQATFSEDTEMEVALGVRKKSAVLL